MIGGFIMREFWNTIQLIFTAVGGWLGWFLGGSDGLLFALIAFVVIDYITGENAHSREFSEDAYRLAAEPKELYIVPGAGHVDLYDRVGLIPFDKLEFFFKEYLKK